MHTFEEPKYLPPSDVDLVLGNLNDADRFPFSVFDFDVTIVHIHPGMRHTIGYRWNIPKVAADSSTALEHGRTVMCLPQSTNFRPESLREIGDPVYDWLKYFSVVLRSNSGVDIKASGAGLAQEIQEYLKYTPAYHQIVIEPKAQPERRLAVVDDTEIIVGLEHPFKQGILVILPPLTLEKNRYILAMSKLVDVARRYYERAQRRIPVGDAPDWIRGCLVKKALDLNRQIEELSEEQSRYEKLAYVLYGTGHELEESVALLLEEFGLDVVRQPPGSNIDLTATHTALGIGFAFEVTGTKGIVRKDSNKIAQAWQYINDRAGTPQVNDRLVIVANTQYHLDPKDRKKESYSQNVAELLGSNEVLLVTTLQLYEQWKLVHEGKKPKEDIVKELHDNYGLYKPK